MLLCLQITVLYNQLRSVREDVPVLLVGVTGESVDLLLSGQPVIGHVNKQDSFSHTKYQV